MSFEAVALIKTIIKILLIINRPFSETIVSSSLEK